jgi:hypothetical protein
MSPPRREVAALMLSDGIRRRQGDPVIHLHFWNEHLPAMPEGPSTGWANLMKRRMRHSLTTLAGYLCAIAWRAASRCRRNERWTERRA